MPNTECMPNTVLHSKTKTNELEIRPNISNELHQK